MALRNCSACAQPFNLSELESRLLRDFGLPVPELCPDHRARERLAWRNERVLYRRRCDATGKAIISIFDQSTPFPVYSQDYWWSDSWDPLSYGREFDFSRPFFEQFIELFHAVPQVALRCPQSENCEFTNQCEKNKDCYLVFCSNHSRECLHGMWFQSCTNCIDCTYLERSELCYEVLNGKQCYNCSFSENLQNCADCRFCKNLIGCSSCFGCINLRNKKNCFLNRQLSESEYRLAVDRLELHRYTRCREMAAQVQSFWSSFPVKYLIGQNNEDCTGDYLENNRNAANSFNCRNSENIIHCRDAWSARNSADLTETLEQDFCIQLEGSYQNVNSGFCAKISESSDCWYSSHCFFSNDLLGCVSLKHQRYCILNMRYEPDEYRTLRARIVQHMQETGEWGRYFPSEYSPFAYNESVAQEYFPLRKEQALAQGRRWKDATPVDISDVSVERLPDSIRDLTPEQGRHTYLCRETGRAFKLQAAETALLKRLDIPAPRLHPDARHAERMNRRNPRCLFARSCALCGVVLQSAVPPSSPTAVLCDGCFSDEADLLMRQ